MRSIPISLPGSWKDLGRYYAETHWEYNGTPQQLLTAAKVRDLPARSLIPLHTGMGLSLARRLLASLTPQSPDIAIDTLLRRVYRALSAELQGRLYGSSIGSPRAGHAPALPPDSPHY